MNVVEKYLHVITARMKTLLASLDRCFVPTDSRSMPKTQIHMILGRKYYYPYDCRDQQPSSIIDIDVLGRLEPWEDRNFVFVFWRTLSWDCHLCTLLRWLWRIGLCLDVSWCLPLVVNGLGSPLIFAHSRPVDGTKTRSHVKNTGAPWRPLERHLSICILTSDARYLRSFSNIEYKAGLNFDPWRHPFSLKIA